MRLVVVERMGAEQAVAMLGDADWRIRLAASLKVPLQYLAGARDDADEEVRAAARERLETASGTGVYE